LLNNKLKPLASTTRWKFSASCLWITSTNK